MKELLHCSYLSLNFAMNQWIVVMDEHLSMACTQPWGKCCPTLNVR